MQNMNFSAYTDVWLIVLTSVVVILLLCIIFLMIKNVALNNRISDIFDSVGKNKDMDVEALFKKIFEDIDKNKNDITSIQESIQKMDKNLALTICKTGIVNYNPFAGVGGNLSFALAFLNRENDGYVINTVFTSDASYTYCKQILAGESSRKLSEEEVQAITLAKNQVV